VPPGLGIVRYKVEVGIVGRTMASPGTEATDTFGTCPGVHRVSIRRGDDFLGWLIGYLLVPEVFGSAGDGLGPRRRAVAGPQRSGRAVPRPTRRSARRLRSGDPHGPPAPGDRAARATGAGDRGRAALATGVTDQK
jgi:hypothetical protein